MPSIDVPFKCGDIVLAPRPEQQQETGYLRQTAKILRMDDEKKSARIVWFRRNGDGGHGGYVEDQVEVREMSLLLNAKVQAKTESTSTAHPATVVSVPEVSSLIIPSADIKWESRANAEPLALEFIFDMGGKNCPRVSRSRNAIKRFGEDTTIPSCPPRKKALATASTSKSKSSKPSVTACTKKRVLSKRKCGNDNNSNPSLPAPPSQQQTQSSVRIDIKKPFTDRQKLRQVSILLKRALEYDNGDDVRDCIAEALQVIDCTSQQQSKRCFQQKNGSEYKQYSNGMTRDEVEMLVRGICDSGVVSGLCDDDLEDALDELEEEGIMTINHAWERLEKNFTYDEQSIHLEKPTTVDPNDLEGYHIYKHFEEGKPANGVVTYRVVYEDHDTETLYPNQVIHWNNVFNKKILPNGSNRFMMELFSGCGIVTSEFMAMGGWSCVSIDNNPDSNAILKMNIEEVRFDRFPPPDAMWISLPCTTYSKANTCRRHRGNVQKGEYNNTPESFESDAHLCAIWRAMSWAKRERPHVLFALENPAHGKLQHMPLMKSLVEAFKLIRIDVYYCSFGRDEYKPTSIWTNCQSLADYLKENHSKCKCKRAHFQVQGNLYSHNFAAIPKNLAVITAKAMSFSLDQSLSYG
eukprot:CAMPEP_0196817122 /NCGR_PEP_ID=MMETSP1362-20130617/58853_1 /TAXON_ID=163516 /ORGANISM="Leptocylindrus danicus, Strain CCMP1856" /LENGTH=634 /DNA_ID=CAMNT_0042194691 /DNA_START=63 /DNA_END=1964 /DNA_ORIENTATION=-